jgi:hypothetical protein
VPIGTPLAEPALYNQSITRGRFVECTGFSTVSRFMVALLEFTGGEPGTTDMNASVTDCSFEQCQGEATNRGIVVKNSHSTGSIERLTFTDCEVDMARAADASTQEIRIQTDAGTGGAIRGVTFTRTTITNPVNSTLRVGGPNISGLTFDTCDFAAPSGAAPLVAVVDGASDVTFRGCSFSGTHKNGTGVSTSKRVLVAGPTAPVTNLVVDGSRFTDIGNTFFGVDVLSATGATITGSTFIALAGATTARAVRTMPEATNVVVEKNDLTGISHAAPILDRGVGSVVTANTGA